MCSCYTLLFILSSILPTLSFEIERGVNEPLIEPPIIDLTSDGASTTIYTRLCKHSVTNSAGLLYIRMTRYCYCTHESDDSSCSIPGPTLFTKGNTKISITQVNQLKGAAHVPDLFDSNHFKDMDVTNIHTHGIHVSPDEDDVLIAINPGEEFTYTYTYGYHYPGTHWYHAHCHGGVAFQLNVGLYGAQIMTSDDILEKDLSKYSQNVLLFNWQWAYPKSKCIPDANKGGSSSSICPGRNIHNNIVTHPIDDMKYSLCYQYCEMPTSQLDASEYIYDIETELSTPQMLFFVNGQLEPIINDLEVGIYRRLRFINALNMFYIQFKFPYECEWYFIAQDGIYHSGNNKNYPLSSSSHENELLLSAGGRADLMVKCNTRGLFHIISSENNELIPQFIFNEDRIPSGTRLFSIQVNDKQEIFAGKWNKGKKDKKYKKKYKYSSSSSSSDSSEWPDIGGRTDILPLEYPQYPFGSYIEDTLNGNIELCDCNKPSEDPLFELPNYINYESECYFEFTDYDLKSVNGEQFHITHTTTPLLIEDALTVIKYNKLYEFTINNGIGSHIYHQHIMPFQFQHSVGKNGFIALEGSWSDTFGNNGSIQHVNVRSWTRDYYGIIVFHCHLVQHEDQGMMAYFNVLPTNDQEYYCPHASGNQQEIIINNDARNYMYGHKGYDNVGIHMNKHNEYHNVNGNMDENNNNEIGVIHLLLIFAYFIIGIVCCGIGICIGSRWKHNVENKKVNVKWNDV